ncbi:hemolysin type calcium-binding protein [Pseudoroseicyclus aestuarii]|uniref:Hemolysin type calcium-binding protein n=2 Tax=Pseudoroseicyclus aestuarii TaxID=1795041 RepID=A0A318SMY0_9RHOB|nr:hemolysin type calcium-binding protein [Pseudoroseicyclus aestuarii]
MAWLHAPESFSLDVDTYQLNLDAADTYRIVIDTDDTDHFSGYIGITLWTNEGRYRDLLLNTGGLDEDKRAVSENFTAETNGGHILFTKIRDSAYDGGAVPYQIKVERVEDRTPWSLDLKATPTGAEAILRAGDAVVQAGTNISVTLEFDTKNLSYEEIALLHSGSRSTSTSIINDTLSLTIRMALADAVSLEDVLSIKFASSAKGALTLESANIRIDGTSVPLNEPEPLITGSDLYIEGDEADNILTGTVADNEIIGLGGDDRLSGGDGADTLSGGEGDDLLYGGASMADLRDVIYGGAGDDRIDGGYGNDLLYGGTGADEIAGGFGADTVIGNEGADILTGGALGDILVGGDGFDFLNGGFGHDRMNGGEGPDRFFHLGVFDHGSDWVQDYSSAEGDRLVWGGGEAGAARFQVNYADTPNAGAAGTQEAFVIDKATGQILWALVDGADEVIRVQVGADVFEIA